MMKKETKIIFFLLATGLLLRLLGLINIRLGGDFALYWKIAGDIAGLRSFPRFGPAASVNHELFFGPFYYYFLAIPYFLGAGNYKIAIIFFSVIGTLNIYLLYRVGREYFGERIGLVSAALYSFSFYMITVDNFPWNAYSLPLFILLSLFSISQINKGKSAYVILLGVSTGLAIQLHGTAFILLPLIFLLLAYKKISIKYLITGLIILAVLLFPYIIQINEIAGIFIKPKLVNCNLIDWLKNHGHGEYCFWWIRNPLFALRFLSTALFGSRNLIMVGLTVMLSVLTFVLERKDKRRFLTLWIGIPVLIFLFYPSNIYLHYFIPLFPAAFFILAEFIVFMNRYGKTGKTVGRLLFYTTIFVNILTYFVSLASPRM